MIFLFGSYGPDSDRAGEVDANFITPHQKLHLDLLSIMTAYAAIGAIQITQVLRFICSKVNERVLLETALSVILRSLRCRITESPLLQTRTIGQLSS
jgi:hypothetical protein